MCLPHNVTLTRIAHGHADRICAAGQPRRGGRAQRRARRAPGSRARPRGPRAPPRRRRGFGVVPAAARGRGRRGCGTGEGITERGTMVPQSGTRSRGSRRRGPARGRRRRRAATPTARAAAPGARSPGRAGAVACAACGIAPDAFPSGRQGQPRQHAARGIARAHPHDERFF